MREKRRGMGFETVASMGGYHRRNTLRSCAFLYISVRFPTWLHVEQVIREAESCNGRRAQLKCWQIRAAAGARTHRFAIRYTGTSGSWRSASCVCVCGFYPFILDIKFVGRTSRVHTGGRSHTIFHPPSFCGACLNFSREKDSAIAFPRRP